MIAIQSGSDSPLIPTVIKPVGYRLRNGSKLPYRDPVFPIYANLTLAIDILLPACNHRDEKSFSGVAQGQVRNPLAVARLLRFQVAGYSQLLLPSSIALGTQRTAEFLPLPKWRGKSIRPSALDILNLLRQQPFSRQLQPVPDNKNSFGHVADIHAIDAKSRKPAFAACLPFRACRASNLK